MGCQAAQHLELRSWQQAQRAQTHTLHTLYCVLASIFGDEAAVGSVTATYASDEL